ncbi:hypothetical protein HOK00_10780 [bacterium]|nr:hypothetical protein [bacterium]
MSKTTIDNLDFEEFFIKNKPKKDIYIKSFDKKYLVSFQNRNDKDAEHLIITNYKI